MPSSGLSRDAHPLPEDVGEERLLQCRPRGACRHDTPLVEQADPVGVAPPRGSGRARRRRHRPLRRRHRARCASPRSWWPRSSEAVGSSRNSTGVHWASTRANVASACSPPESVRKLRSARCAIPCPGERLGHDVAEAVVALAQRVAAHLDHLPHGEAEADGRVLRHHRAAARELVPRQCRRRWPRRARRFPPSALVSPARSRSSVDFPRRSDRRRRGARPPRARGRRPARSRRAADDVAEPCGSEQAHVQPP